MRFLLTAGLAAMFAATAAPAQLQIGGTPSQPSVNAWDALTTAQAKTVRIEGCTEGDCSAEALVLDNQAGSTCLENMVVAHRYSFDGREVVAAEVALKIDAEALAATRYYRAVVTFPRKGVQRLCVRGSMQVSGMRFTVSLDGPADSDQLTQMARIATSGNRSATELRLAPLVTPRRPMAMSPDIATKLARSLFNSESRLPLSLIVQSSGPSLPIELAGESLGVTNKTLYVPAAILREIQVRKDGALVPIRSCASMVNGAVLIVRC